MRTVRNAFAALAVSVLVGLGVVVVAPSASADGTTPGAAINLETGVGYAEASYVMKVSLLSPKQFKPVAASTTYQPVEMTQEKYDVACTSTVDAVTYRVNNYNRTDVVSSYDSRAGRYTFSGYGASSVESTPIPLVGDACPSVVGTGEVTEVSESYDFYSSQGIVATIPTSPPVVQAILIY